MRCGARSSPWQHGRRRTSLILAVLFTTLRVAGLGAFRVAGFDWNMHKALDDASFAIIRSIDTAMSVKSATRTWPSSGRFVRWWLGRPAPGRYRPVFVLGLADDVNGVEGRKHQTYVLAVVALGHLGGEACGSGGDLERGTVNCTNQTADRDATRLYAAMAPRCPLL